MENFEFRFDSDISSYKKLLEDIREEIKVDPGKIIPIRNDSFYHAVVLVSDILTYANEDVYLYSSSLCKPFYDNNEIKEALTAAKKNGVKLSIILRKKENTTSDVKKKELESAKGIKDILGDRLDGIRQSTVIAEDGNYELNDFIVTGKSFRYELECPKSDQLQSCEKYDVKAVASLNDEESASWLRESFLKSYSKAQELKID